MCRHTAGLQVEPSECFLEGDSIFGSLPPPQSFINIFGAEYLQVCCRRHGRWLPPADVAARLLSASPAVCGQLASMYDDAEAERCE